MIHEKRIGFIIMFFTYRVRVHNFDQKDDRKHDRMLKLLLTLEHFAEPAGSTPWLLGTIIIITSVLGCGLNVYFIPSRHPEKHTFKHHYGFIVSLNDVNITFECNYIAAVLESSMMVRLKTDIV